MRSLLFASLVTALLLPLAGRGAPPPVEIRVIKGVEWVYLDGSSLGPIQTLPAGTREYRWSEEKYRNEMLKDGHVTEETLSKRAANPDPGLVAGSGVYVSSSPMDSSMFGSHVVVIENEKPVRIVVLDGAEYGQLFNATERIPLLKSVGIQGVNYLGTWTNLFSADALTRVRPLSVADLPDKAPQHKEQLLRLLSQPEIMKSADTTKVSQLLDEVLREAPGGAGAQAFFEKLFAICSTAIDSSCDGVLERVLSGKNNPVSDRIREYLSRSDVAGELSRTNIPSRFKEAGMTYPTAAPAQGACPALGTILNQLR